MKRVYQVAAEAFYAEGVRHVFALTGDGNMHWEAAIAALPGVNCLHVRHEHAAIAMATAFAQKSGHTGIASVTCGPGLTQIMTALATAAEAHIPLVVFVGEDPIAAEWYNQRIDQAPLVTATGAVYMAIRHEQRLRNSVQQAFVTAALRRLPVVIGIPLDLQQKLIDDAPYVPSQAVLPAALPRLPHPQQIEAALERISVAQRILVIGGRGASSAGARAAMSDLAELVNGGLSSTLPVRGLFTGEPLNLGLAGGYAHQRAAHLMRSADLVITAGASLTRYTSGFDDLFKPAQIIAIDQEPRVQHGRIPAGSYIEADAELALNALIDGLKLRACVPRPDWGVRECAAELATARPDDATAPDAQGEMDPATAIRALDEVIPKDWLHVSGAGHCAYFAAHMYDRSHENFLAIREFGAIGNGLSYAMGAAAARPGQQVFMTDGDGGFLMHIQELETLQRSGSKLLLIILNDGAYGSEIHKLRADGLSVDGAVFGYGRLQRIAEGFGLAAATITSASQLKEAFARFNAGSESMLWDLRISANVMAPTMRKLTSKAS